jgi:hypothetical protein
LPRSVAADGPQIRTHNRQGREENQGQSEVPFRPALGAADRTQRERESEMANDPVAERARAGTATAVERKDRVVLRSYPKIVLLYPTWLAAIIAGIVTSSTDAASIATALTFLIVAGLNLIVLSFEFPRTTSLTLLFLIVAVIFGALWLNHYWVFLPQLRDWVARLTPEANSQFYWLLAVVLTVIYVFVFIDTRFDYWEIMPNEILHHHGILGNVNRFPAPQLKFEKEITDVFEFFLLRSGRLLLHPSTERRAIVLENVPNINRREDEIGALLRVLDVHVHTDRELHEDMVDNA